MSLAVHVDSGVGLILVMFSRRGAQRAAAAVACLLVWLVIDLCVEVRAERYVAQHGSGI